MKQIGKNKILFIFSLIFCLMFFTAIVNAQFNLPNIKNIKSTISLTSDPITPLPNSIVAVTANLSGMPGGENPIYDWFLNGIKQSEASGLNKNTLIFKTGIIGSVYRVSVNVKTSTEELSDTFNFTVSDADLTWSVDSQAPAAYRAKLMPTQNSIITISSLPFIYRPGAKNQISPNDLVYNWIIDGKLDSFNSGANKNLYTLKVDKPLRNSYLIRLEIKTADNAVSLSKFTAIPVVKPQILLYLSDPKTNKPLNTAIKSLVIGSASLNFIAQPYFFTVSAKNLKWQWFINSEKIESKTEKPWLATLNLKDNLGQLSIQVKTVAENPDNNLEISESTIDLETQ